MTVQGLCQVRGLHAFCVKVGARVMLRRHDDHRSLGASIAATFSAIALAVLTSGCDEMVQSAAEQQPAAAAPAAAPVVPAADPAAAAPAAIDAASVPDVIVLSPPFRSKDGFVWIANVPVPPTVVKLSLFEDGKELGPPDSKHVAIRETGLGAYSHWKGGTSGPLIYFSTSDNSDPNTNGRTYEARKP
jgi:hypothetical protein